jgi:hypothetical protein
MPGIVFRELSLFGQGSNSPFIVVQRPPSAKCCFALAFFVLEEFNLAKALLRRRFAFVWAAQILSLLGYHLVARLNFFDHV